MAWEVIDAFFKCIQLKEMKGGEKSCTILICLIK